MSKSRLPLLSELLDISPAGLSTRIPVAHIAPSTLLVFLFSPLFILYCKSLHLDLDNFLNLGRVRFPLQFTFKSTSPAKRVCSSSSSGRPNAACLPQENFLFCQNEPPRCEPIIDRSFFHLCFQSLLTYLC